MKTILILETSLDGLRFTKNKLVEEFTQAGNLKKWSDDLIETLDDQIYFLKVVSLNEYRSKLTQIIGRGYDEIRVDPVKKEIAGLLEALNLTVFSHVKGDINEKDLEPGAGKIEATPSVLDDKNNDQLPSEEVVDTSKDNAEDLSDPTPANQANGQ